MYIDGIAINSLKNKHERSIDLSAIIDRLYRLLDMFIL